MHFLHALWAIFIVIPFISAKTILEEITQRPELKKYSEMAALGQSNQATIFFRDNSMTAFIPTNEALESFRAKVTVKDLIEFINNQYTASIITKDLFPTMVTSSGSPQSVYFSVKNSNVLPKELSPTQSPVSEPSKLEYYINNAKILDQIECTSSSNKRQILYIVDEVVNIYSSQKRFTSTAYDILTGVDQFPLLDTLRFQNFARLLKNDPSLAALFNNRMIGNHTFFVPVDSTFSDNLDVYQARAHVLPNHALFSRTFRGNQDYPSAMWDSNILVSINKPEPVVKPGNYFNSTAFNLIESHTIKTNSTNHHLGTIRTSFTKANVPVSNGVIHFIDYPFMAVSRSVWDLIEANKDGQLSKFYQLIIKHPDVLNVLKSDNTITLFAPANSAFEKISKDKLDPYLTNDTLASAIARLHVHKGTITKNIVSNGYTTSESLDANRKLYYQIAQATDNLQVLTVEGGGVNATAIHPDMGASNGRIHIIDKVLGIPYQTVYGKIHDDFDMVTTYIVGSHRNDYWNRKLNNMDTKITYFTPSRSAWKNLSIEFPSEHKQLIEGLLPKHGEDILERHLRFGNDFLTYEDLKKMDGKVLQNLRGKLNVKVVDGEVILEWEGRKARVVRPDVNALNGIIHVIDNVLMLKRDMSPGTNASSRLNSFSILNCVLIISFFAKLHSMLLKL